MKNLLIETKIVHKPILGHRELLYKLSGERYEKMLLTVLILMLQRTIGFGGIIWYTVHPDLLLCLSDNTSKESKITSKNPSEKTVGIFSP